MSRLVALALVLTTSCVTSSAHQKLQTERDDLAKQLEDRTVALQGCNAALLKQDKKVKEARKGWNLVPVVVASQDMPENTVVTGDMISQRALPEQFVTSSVVKPESASYIVNQKLLVPVQAGDLLLWSQFETTKAAERLSTRVPKNTRIVTIQAGGSAGVGGWVRPNDRVDVIAVIREGSKGDASAVTILQNVLVVATGRITGRTNVNVLPEEDRRYDEVSLAVTPAEAERLTLAQQVGSLSLSLRNEDDVAVPATGRTTLKSLQVPAPATPRGRALDQGM